MKPGELITMDIYVDHSSNPSRRKSTLWYSEVKFPEETWAELISTPIYVLNKTGKSSEAGINPLELWIKRNPRVKHLRIVAFKCYVHVPAQKRHKMDNKAEKGY